MLSAYVRGLSLLLWMGVMAIIARGVLHGIYILFRHGTGGTGAARKTVGAAIVSGLGLTTAMALLATTELRSWSSIGLFAGVAALRTFVKFSETQLIK